MSYELNYLPEAVSDMQKLDGSQRKLVRKALAKLSINPLPQTEGGYGQWLGNKGDANLAGFLKVKLRGAGLRIVYTLKRENEKVLIIFIGAREDEEVYEIAAKRIQKNIHLHD